MKVATDKLCEEASLPNPEPLSFIRHCFSHMKSRMVMTMQNRENTNTTMNIKTPPTKALDSARDSLVISLNSFIITPVAKVVRAQVSHPDDRA